MPNEAGISGVVLAGGLSRRFGGDDKCLRELAGRSLLTRVVERARPQVEPMVLNANGDPARYAGFGLPVAADVVTGFVGPLAGVLTGLEWALDNAPGCRIIASFPCDAPFLPRDLVSRLSLALGADGADIAYAASGGRDHPVFGLWPVRLAGELRRALVEEGVRKVDAWTARYAVARVEFGILPVDPFFNLNRVEDFAVAEREAARFDKA